MDFTRAPMRSSTIGIVEPAMVHSSVHAPRQSIQEVPKPATLQMVTILNHAAISDGLQQLARGSCPDRPGIFTRLQPRRQAQAPGQQPPLPVGAGLIDRARSSSTRSRRRPPRF